MGKSDDEPQLSNSEPEKAEPDSEKAEAESESAPTRKVTGLKWVLACIVIYISVFVYGLDTTVAADVQSAVVEEFGSVKSLSWLGVGFLMASVATSLPVGCLFKRFDTKWNFLAGVFLFELGSAVCGSAPNINALIVGRVIAGVGGSGLYLGALNLLTSLTTDKERGGYISAIGVFWGSGAIIGPIVGGAFSSSKATWRWAFYINLLIAAVSAPAFLFCIPSVHPMTGASIKKRLLSIDWVGTVLNAVAWVLFTVALTFGGSTWAWNSGSIIAVWVVLGVVIIAFVLQQRFAIFTDKENRIFPAHLLMSRTQLLLYFGTSTSACSMFVPIYYIPLWFQFVQGDSAIEAAVRLLPFLAVAFSVNFATGTLLPRIQYYALLYVVAGVFIIAGGGALSSVNEMTPIANVYGFSILIALGAGATVQAGYSLAAIKLTHQGRDNDVSHGIAFQNVAQIGTGAIGLIIAGAIFQNYAVQNLNMALAGKGYSSMEIQAAVAGAQSDLFSKLDPALRLKAVAAITAAMRKVFVLVPVAGAVSALSGLAMRWEKLFQ